MLIQPRRGSDPSVHWWMNGQRKYKIYLYLIPIQWNITPPWKRRKDAICDNIDGSWGHWAKWNKSYRERQTVYWFSVFFPNTLRLWTSSKPCFSCIWQVLIYLVFIIFFKIFSNLFLFLLRHIGYSEMIRYIFKSCGLFSFCYWFPANSMVRGLILNVFKSLNQLSFKLFSSPVNKYIFPCI